jgi:WD40 repeat protein
MNSENAFIATTTAPTSSVNPGGGGGAGGGGSLSVMCPNTGSVFSSLRVGADLSGNALLGMSSFSLFPKKFSGPNNRLAVAFGQNGSKKNDTHGMLISIRPSPLPPIVHWKCRLPEAQLTAGLEVSPCGYYVVGGGASGNCFIWSTIGGKLLRSFKSHYRSCTKILWSECGKFVVTGGADGMVHSFLLMDLVDRAASKKSIAPSHSWSSHHLPVTSLANLDGGRVASASEDSQVIIMELFSRSKLATIQLPSGITCLQSNNGTIYAGSKLGDIFCIDLNAYAMRQASKSGANTAKRRRQGEKNDNLSFASVFQQRIGNSSDDSDETYDTKLKGHDHPVTSMAISIEKGNRRLISGDASGVIRIWDLESMTCLAMVRPWHNSGMQGATKADASTTSKDSNKALKKQTSPISSIVVLPQPTEPLNKGGLFNNTSSQGKNQITIVKLLTPLSKFQEEADGGSALLSVPHLRSKRTAALRASLAARPVFKPPNKVQLTKTLVASRTSSHTSDKILQEREYEIEELKAQIKRWEQVNNQLMAKLKGST